ncbi:MAG TPA: hypothetical protein VJB97_05010 [Candidatus Paceibacterota bacterium]
MYDLLVEVHADTRERQGRIGGRVAELLFETPYAGDVGIELVSGKLYSLVDWKCGMQVHPSPYLRLVGSIDSLERCEQDIRKRLAPLEFEIVSMVGGFGEKEMNASELRGASS